LLLLLAAASAFLALQSTCFRCTQYASCVTTLHPVRTTTRLKNGNDFYSPISETDIESGNAVRFDPQPVPHSRNVSPTREYELTILFDPINTEAQLKGLCSGYISQLKKMGATEIVVIYRGKKILFGKINGSNMGRLVDIGFRLRPGGVQFLKMRLDQEKDILRFMINKPIKIPWKKVVRVWKTGRGPKANRPDIVGILPYQQILQDRGYELKDVEDMLAKKKSFV